MLGKSQSGFSLIEMSIVLIIISFLIFTISSGVTFLRDARFKSIITEYDIYKTQIGNFKSQYKDLPGDHPRAFDIWGTGCAATAAACNGDGNGIVDSYQESFRAWQHLSLAGLTQGSLSGSAVSNQAIIGQNVPQSSFNNAGWTICSKDTACNSASTTIGDYIEIGSYTIQNLPISVVMTPTQAFLIDEKIDDGLPTTGFVQSPTSQQSATGCYSSGSYNISIASSECTLRFILPE